jgi:hypothetical protein
MKPGGLAASPAMLQVAKRVQNGTAVSKFQVLDPRTQAVAAPPDDRITVSNINQIDGEYVILVNPQATATGKCKPPDSILSFLSSSRDIYQLMTTAKKKPKTEDASRRRI